MTLWQSGYARVCKTRLPQFDSGKSLHNKLQSCRTEVNYNMKIKEVIEALTILDKYEPSSKIKVHYDNPISCFDDDLLVDVDPATVSAEDRNRLDALGWLISRESLF